jgi:hypothetical protein
MHADPLDIFRGPDPESTPDPAFVARLRRDLLELAAEARAQPDPRPADAPGNGAEPARPMERFVPDVRRARRRRARLLLVAAVLVALASVAVVLASRDQGDKVDVIDDTTSTSGAPATSTTGGQPATTTTALTTTTDLNANRPDLPPIQSLESAGVEIYDAAADPTQVATDGTTVWVLHDRGPINRYDAATGALLGMVDVPNRGTAEQPAVAFGSLWVTTDEDNKLWRIDAATGVVQASIDIPGEIIGLDLVNPINLTVGDGVIWVLTRDPSSTYSGGGPKQEPRFVRVDPTTNSVTGSIVAPPGAHMIGYGFGSLWTIAIGGPLIRVDPDTGAQLASLPMNFAFMLRTGFGSIWLDDGRAHETLLRVDPSTNTIVAEIPNADGQGFWRSDVAFGGGYLWTSSAAALLVKIDPQTNKIVARYGASTAGGGVAATDTDVWFTDWSTKKLYRLRLA